MLLNYASAVATWQVSVSHTATAVTACDRLLQIVVRQMAELQG